MSRLARVSATLLVALSLVFVTSSTAQATTRSWGPVYVEVIHGNDAEANGRAGWRDGQPWVRANYQDYNGMYDNDQTFVQATFYRYETWVCGINGQTCSGYRAKETKRTEGTWRGDVWYTQTLRLGHRAAGQWLVRARVCDKDMKTHHRACSSWTRYMRVH